MSKIEFRQVTPQDLPLIRAWLEQPHWQQWWEAPEVELGYIVDMIEGRDNTRPFLFYVDDAPCGYIQYWFASHHQNDGSSLKDYPWLAGLSPETIGIDLSIGDENMLSKGLGSKALNLFAQMLTRLGYGSIIIDPDVNNKRAIRAYEKAGFGPVAELQGRTQDVLLMQFDPKVNLED